MVITTTSVAFILLGVGLGVCGWRFWSAYRKGVRDDKTGLLLSIFLFGFSFQTGVLLGLGTLFSAGNPAGLLAVLVTANFFLTILALLGIYTSYYIFLPQKSPWPPMLIVFILGAITFILTIADPPQPFIAPSGGIEWNANFLISLFVFYLLLISIGAQLYIFGRLFFQAVTREIKLLSFALAVLAAGGIIDNFLRFIILYGVEADFRTRVYDIGTAALGMGFIVVFVVVPLIRSWITAHGGSASKIKNSHLW